MISGFQRVLDGGAYGVDGVGVAFGVLFVVLWGVSGLYAALTVRGRDRTRLFAYFIPAAAGGIGVAFAADAVSFYLCFALMALASWGLVAFERTGEARRAGAIYLTATVIGEALLLAALMVLASEAGTIELEALRGAWATVSHADTVFVLVVAAFALKLGAFPASGVLPLTYAHAPAGAAAALAGATVKVGVLGLVRLLPLGELSASGWSTALIVLGLASAFGAALLGVLTTTPRAVLGYSSASQMGLVLIGIGAGLAAPEAGRYAVAAAVAYSLHHGLAKAALFMGEDVVRRSAVRSSGHSAADSAGRPTARSVGITKVALALPALALVGVPFTSGFVAKYALKDAVHAASGQAVVAAEALLPWAAVATALLMLRFFTLLPDARSRRRTADAKPAKATTAAERRSALAPSAVWGALLVLVTGLVWLWPADWAESAAESGTHLDSLLSATWPALVALAVGWAASRASRSLERVRLDLVTPGDVLLAGWRAASALSEASERVVPSVTAVPDRRGVVGPWLIRFERTWTTWTVAAGLFVLAAAVLVILAG